VKAFSSAEIAKWACTSLSASAVVVSDGLACFRAVVASGGSRLPEVVGKDQKSTDMGCFYWVNTVPAMLRPQSKEHIIPLIYLSTLNVTWQRSNIGSIVALIFDPFSRDCCTLELRPASEPRHGYGLLKISAIG
jgi:hypothetical protein